MNIQISPLSLNHPCFNVQGFQFSPAKNPHQLLAIMTHGYTSHKNSLLTWASKLASQGCHCLVFDLPGHFLGSFEDIECFEDFRDHAHELFLLALNHTSFKPEKLLLLGHSIGAFLSLKALTLPEVAKYSTLNICVGLGVHQEGKPHLMETPFYKPTLDIRRQYVSKHLAPEKVFPWLRAQKDILKIHGKDILVLNGKDDAVVGEKGGERLLKLLQQLNNHAYLEEPSHLPHHKPELAASHIVSILKKRFQIFE